MNPIIVLLQVIFLDICLSGDNAVVIAMAAMGLPAFRRRLAIIFGISIAIIARILFSVGMVRLLDFPLLSLAGGLMLAWVSWKMWQEIRLSELDKKTATMGGISFAAAIMQIAVSDISMSLDNIVAIASAAQNYPFIMAVGFVVSISMMAVAASYVTKLLDRWPVLKYAGLMLIIYISGKMIWTSSARIIAA